MEESRDFAIKNNNMEIIEFETPTPSVNFPSTPKNASETTIPNISPSGDYTMEISLPEPSNFPDDQSNMFDHQSNMTDDNFNSSSEIKDHNQGNNAVGSPHFDVDQISDDSNDVRTLVPYSEHSDFDISSDIPQKSKTRRKRFQVKQSTWFSEKNKLRRQMGQRYLGRSKKNGKWNYEKEKGPREMKSRCKCTLNEKALIKCASITEKERAELFIFFWNLTWGEKKAFIDSVVTATPTKRPRQRKDPHVSRRGQSLLYYLRVNET